MAGGRVPKGTQAEPQERQGSRWTARRDTRGETEDAERGRSEEGFPQPSQVNRGKNGATHPV